MQSKLLILAVVLVSCFADEPIGAAKISYTPQEKFLARSNLANFACKVNSVQVETTVAGEEDKRVISQEEIEAFLSQTATLEWVHVNQFFFASVDGRNDEKNLGTPGGDLGEIIQALESYTVVTGHVFTYEEVEKLFQRYLKIMSREKIFFETDEKAYRKLAISTGCQNLKIAEIAEKRKKDAILQQFASPEMAEFIGDPFIKYLANNAEELGIHREYISYVIQAFHTSLWKHNQDSEKLCYMEMKGRVDPKALVQVKTPGFCIDQGLAPLISSQLCGGQAFIVHTDAVKLFRRELVQLISQPNDNPQDILARFNVVAQTHLEKFWDTYIGLPSFTATFSNTNLEAFE